VPIRQLDDCVSVGSHRRYVAQGPAEPIRDNERRSTTSIGPAMPTGWKRTPAHWRPAASSATEQERLEALKYVGHWVGDLHQPLHASFEDDRGGNAIGVSGGLCSRDLHAVWDRCIIEQGLPGDSHTLARQLSAR
jgi:hypothetical protein